MRMPWRACDYLITNLIMTTIEPGMHFKTIFNQMANFKPLVGGQAFLKGNRPERQPEHSPPRGCSPHNARHRRRV